MKVLGVRMIVVIFDGGLHMFRIGGNTCKSTVNKVWYLNITLHGVL